MAGGSQHLIKIMATQTRFDLNAAIENWRNELAAQSQLTADDRRELEKHIADAMAELRQRGLNEEESFWLARRRIGRPQQLAEEFQKADPAKVWRERVFWLAWAYSFFVLWTGFVAVIPFNISWIGDACLAYLPPICLAILLAKGRLKADRYIPGSFFKDRWFFAGSAIIFLLLTRGVPTWEHYAAQNEVALRFPDLKLHAPLQEFWANEIQVLAFPLMIIAVAVWLMPTKSGKAPKGA
jgi:hypothetical protein